MKVFITMKSLSAYAAMIIFLLLVIHDTLCIFLVLLKTSDAFTEEFDDDMQTSI